MMNRNLAIFSSALLLGSACQTTPPEQPTRPQRTIRTQVQPANPTTPAVAPQRTEPAVRPVNALSATVREVNTRLRFVILDYGPGKVPQLDQKLGVYRGTDKVGEIKISGPYRGTTVAADITAGEAKFGDQVREE